MERLRKNDFGAVFLFADSERKDIKDQITY